MLTSPRIIAIDDHEQHLAGLANCLNRHGVACLQIHFNPKVLPSIKPCPDVRVIFADLHLAEGSLTSDHKTDFSIIGTLLESTIKPRGPYFILLWTMYPAQADALREFLQTRLREATKPFYVLPLAKANHLDDGNVRDEEALIQEIVNITKELPEMGALFDWENRVLGAAGNTVSSILDLVSTQESDKRMEEIGRILVRLGIAAVGKQNVADDHFRAVNEALLPILADQIANLRSGDSENDVWQKAVMVTGAETLSSEEVAKLNWMAHFAQLESTNGFERGVVIMLPQVLRDNFSDHFGMDDKEAVQKQFWCKDFDPKNENFRWVLVQTQAACDYAQKQPGPLPWYLALELTEAHKRSKTQPPWLWSSPAFEFGGMVRLLHVNARFPVSISPGDFQCATSVYRLREQILNDLTYKLHSHAARPGMISFREKD